MNDDTNQLDEVELLLKQMPLKAPSLELDARIYRTLQKNPRRSTAHWLTGAIGAAIAAAAVLLLSVLPLQPLQPLPQTTTTVASATSSHPTTTDTAESWLDDGIVGYSQAGPIRQYRLQSVEQYASANSAETPYVYSEQIIQVISQAY